MHAICTLAGKDLRILCRDRLNLVWMFGIPLVFAVFFASIMGGGPSATNPLRVALVDENLDDATVADFARRLRESASVDVTVQSRVDAFDSVRRGRSAALLAVRPRAAADAPFFGNVIPDVELGVDPSRQAEAAMLRGLLTEAAVGGVRELFASPEHGSGAAAFEPRISVVDVLRDRSGQPRSAYEIAFPSAILWGLLAVASAFAVGLARERRQGTMLRLLAAPMPRAAILGGRALACFVAGCVVVATLLVVGHLAFGVRVSSVTGLALAIACSSACFVGISVLVSVAGRSEDAVSGISWGLFILLAMLGGSMVPLVAMPPFMATLSTLSPVRWAIVALEGSIWRDFSLLELLPACGVLLAIGATCFAIGARTLARRAA